ncbi:MAG: prepilin-type N-terminal cleavage/methylation domain-containing protein [Methyloprofundus sp.]|nr:prepilin-type N-terminal cleavage/methylation domain-containing protein [Methyloprofundus sp.]
MSKGFSILELLVVMVIVGVVASLSMPVMTAYKTKQFDQEVSKLILDIKLARSEAAKRNIFVTLRRIGTSWNNGWFSFVDDNGNGKKNSSELIIFSSHKLSDTKLKNGSGFAKYIRFSGAGTAHKKGWLVVKHRTISTLKEVVCIKTSGRTSLSRCPKSSDPCEFTSACS